MEMKVKILIHVSTYSGDDIKEERIYKYVHEFLLLFS